jgi:hypothetical protein
MSTLPQVLQHPALSILRQALEPWQLGIAHVSEMPFEHAFHDECSVENEHHDLVFDIQPKNERAAPLQVFLDADSDRVEIGIDRWWRLAGLLGLPQASRSDSSSQCFVASPGANLSPEVAAEVIRGVACGALFVTAGVMGGRITGTDARLRLPSVKLLHCGVRSITSARLLKYVGMAQVRTFQYEPWINT